jgi:FtsP/CotA-like multicopper oxidase with cupredoxin domain
VPTYDPFNPPPWPSAFPLRVANLQAPGCGSFAAPLLSVNGVAAPARLTVPSGEPQLLRILNATGDSIKYLRLRDALGHLRTLRVVGRDDIPVSTDDAYPLARYVPMRGILLVPAGRVDVLLTLKRAERLTLYSDKRCIAPFDEVRVKHDLLAISAGPPALAPARVATAPLKPDESRAMRLLQYARTHPALVRRRAITYTQYVFRDSPKGPPHPEFFITETSNPNFHEHPFWPVYAKGDSTPQPDIVVKRGTIEEWYLFNATIMPHSFHIHQMDFVTEDQTPPVILDTVLLPVGQLLPNKSDPEYPFIKPGLTRVLLDFRNVRRGTFVFHCHMLFHEDRGMMGVIRVE